MQNSKKTNAPILAQLKVSYDARTVSLVIDSTTGAAQFLRKIWDTPLITIQEQFYSVFLNNRNDVIGWRLISTGTSRSCTIDYKLLCAIALQSFCCSVFIAHNHPSGTLKPSKNDIAITWRIKSTLEMFDIKLLDHLIITNVSYYSFVENDRMQNVFGELIN